MSPFVYQTAVKPFSVGTATLEIEQLVSLDDTIDQYFKEYQKTGEEELFESLCPYFGVPWPAGVALAHYLQERQFGSSFTSALELGCGLALPSFVLAAKGVAVTASDFHPDVPLFLNKNCERNGLRVGYQTIDWQSSVGNADLVFGSDLVYDRRQPETLRDFLARAKPREWVIADPGRPYWEAFLRLVQRDWRVEEFLRDGIFFARGIE